MEPRNDAPNATLVEQPERRRREPLASLRARKPTTGQAIVEFSIVSIAFFMTVFGTIDFGRAIYLYSQLHNAVREGARYGKIDPTNTGQIKDKVITYGSELDLTASDISVSCPGGCSSTSTDVTVSAQAHFQAVTQELLGISPITLTSSATVEAESSEASNQ
jgi:Flp pilus assembly protein TadG